MNIAAIAIVQLLGSLVCWLINGNPSVPYFVGGFWIGSLGVVLILRSTRIQMN